MKALLVPPVVKVHWPYDILNVSAAIVIWLVKGPALDDWAFVLGHLAHLPIMSMLIPSPVLIYSWICHILPFDVFNTCTCSLYMFGLSNWVDVSQHSNKINNRSIFSFDKVWIIFSLHVTQSPFFVHSRGLFLRWWDISISSNLILAETLFLLSVFNLPWTMYHIGMP